MAPVDLLSGEHSIQVWNEEASEIQDSLRRSARKYGCNRPCGQELLAHPLRRKARYQPQYMPPWEIGSDTKVSRVL